MTKKKPSLWLISHLIGLAWISSVLNSSTALAALDNNCPTPHNDCPAACGTTCEYWTCADPINTSNFTVSELPYTIQYETPYCQNKITEFTFNEIQKNYSINTHSGTQTVTLREIPAQVQLATWACLQNSKYGGPCEWAVGGWGECSAVCGYDTVSGIETRSVNCPALDGNCRGPRPESTQPCTRSCPARPVGEASGPCGARCPAWSGEGLYGPGDTGGGFSGGGGFGGAGGPGFGFGGGFGGFGMSGGGGGF